MESPSPQFPRSCSTACKDVEFTVKTCTHSSLFKGNLRADLPKWPPANRRYTIHTLLYLKWITNKDLLYSTGNPAQYPGLIPGLERSPGERNGSPLQYSCLENPMDRGAWQTLVHGVTRVGHDLATKPPPWVSQVAQW
ncbi:hypothetical protein FD755_024367 [Muntiacus reevesi]|uniref:Uncharacterized protein n=1 Tax=Muntiacus reevesi TaxID=9886 RepID=A0A5N3VA26_MUNRE|nr:hypothetical protein FD755_024367 [Muntiacus reevesi]